MKKNKKKEKRLKKKLLKKITHNDQGGNYLSKTNYPKTYYETLKCPEHRLQVGIPRSLGLGSIVRHVTETITLPLSDKGAFAYMFQPFFLSDSSAALSTFGFFNRAGYDGVTNSGLPYDVAIS